MSMKAFLFILSLFLFSCKSDQIHPGEQSTSQVSHREARKDIDAGTAYNLIHSNDPPILIDVRTPVEYQEGNIQGSLLIDYKDDSFKSEINQLDKNATYLIYCRSGGRSSKATDYMISQGFQDVINLEGGYLDWSEKY